jgi:hypothetical protein
MHTDSELLHVARWAAQECAWQMSGELSVGRMFEAWQYACQIQTAERIRFDHVIMIGQLIEPDLNHKGLRTVGVRVGWSVKPRPEEVPHLLDRLLDNQPDMPVKDTELAVEWFRAFEEVHPFRDGNGRTGNILYNLLCGTINDPVFPPNLWNDPRR